MAEIRLGRIKFIWKNEWQTNTEYFKDDLVKYGGNTYVCVARHTSSVFADDFASSWNSISDGQEWRGEWAVSTYYRVNDIVQYGGKQYIANTEHQSTTNVYDGLVIDLEKWTPFGENFDWKGDWTVTTVYKVNDLVKYNSTIYLCIEHHTSTDTVEAGLESQADKWIIYSSSLNWTSSWSTDTRYAERDLVKYGGIIYLCNTGHLSNADVDLGLEADINKWDVFHEGIDYTGEWQTNYRYKKNDLVKKGGGIWICTQYHNSNIFSSDSLNWQQFVEGLEFENSWSEIEKYQPGDTVTYGGYVYVTNQLHSNKVPTENSDVWELFSTGFRFRGDWGEDSSLQDYYVGDVVRVGGYTYLCIEDHQNQKPPNTLYWERLNSGIYWKSSWTNATVYDLGDSVRYGNNSYICILGHTADDTVDQNRPDQTTGFGTGATYWDILSGGPENNVLTTQGDLVYYSGVGPARLPIGKVGQVLAVNADGTAPEWKYIGQINHVVYVEGTNGINQPLPTYGGTINHPFKTIRYALEQIDKGPLFSEATYLLEVNRAFIQNAVVVWVDAQITAGNGIWSGFTNDNIESCRRDIGLILDAVIYDMRHGGNEKIRLATLSYFDNGSLIAAIADENEQLVASIQQMIVIVNAVISNLDYTDANNTIIQYKDSNYLEEQDAQTRIENLLQIIIQPLTAENIDNLAKEYIPNNTVFIKTGKYEETLPMIVPQKTAVVGDELRSTSIYPSESITHISDTTYSLQSLTHMSSFISNIITNTAITPTTGNSETQYTLGVSGTVGDATASTKITTGATEIKNIIENGVDSATALSFSDPGVVTERLYARELIQVNKDFLFSEIETYINAQVAAATAGSIWENFDYDSIKAAACERDVALILDAASYDVQYNSRWASIIIARNYYDSLALTLEPNERLPTADVYDTLAGYVSDVVEGTYPGQTLLTTPGNVGTVTEAAYASSMINIVEDVIRDGTLDNLPAVVYPVLTHVSSIIQSSVATILDRKNRIQNEAVSYIQRANPTLEFNKTTCLRDAGYMIDALVYDMALDTNYQTRISGISYYKVTTSAQTVLNYQLSDTLRAVDYLDTSLSNLSIGGPGTKAEALISTIQDYINNKVNNIGTEPIMTGSNEPLTDTDHTYAVETIEKNRKFIVSEMNAYIANTFTATIQSLSGTDVQTDGTNSDWIQVGTAVKFSNVIGSEIQANTTYFVHSKTDANNFTVKAARTDSAPISWNSAVGSMTMNLAYNTGSCERDINSYIDAIKYDLIYPGNYKSIYAGIYYANAVTGSKLENMFLMHNGSGLRNCSLNALDGRSDGTTVNQSITGLTEVNPNGTARPLAGAYVSLDPGWNPQDTKPWIRTKSPYVQNVSTFGTACIGMKVDGEIHAGGNDSIVANDFTQILSDGIGYWVTNLGRSELVSVFTYYCHIGYLAENGGKVRATNGNNSYGDFGSVSEGVDITEIPVTAQVNNYAFTPVVDRVLTDGNEIIAFEYLNAGKEFTAANTTITVVGDGFGYVIDSAQTVDGGVFEVRMLDLDDSSGIFGGQGYYFATNSAQNGTTTQITLSNTDVGLASQVIGLSIYITGGKGTGQYGQISNYNENTKLADIVKISDGTAGWDQMVAGRSIEATLDATTVYTVEPLIQFSDSDTYPGDYTKNAKGRPFVENEQIVKILIWDPGEGYTAEPTITITDPNNIALGNQAVTDAPTQARIANGVLTQPLWAANGRGNDFTTATVEIVGDGYADFYQPGNLIQVQNLSGIPLAGSNIVFDHLPGQVFKLVVVRSLLGTGQLGDQPPFTAQLQVSPDIQISEAPENNENLTLRIRYSQIRLTGHDFLDIGTGNFVKTNYPGIPLQEPIPANETLESTGGRVFFTSTDQDGNFRVGDLFSVEQSTGVATLNADAFNISGLNELSLGELGLGQTGATITEFSTDGTFTANSDEIVPTQKAIRTYITSQIGGGSSTLNVNSITAGDILITGTEITTVTGNQINMEQKVYYKKGVDGVPVAMNYLLKN